MAERHQANELFDAGRLRYWRHRRALTQTELAERAGLSQVAVAGWETGKRRPTGPSVHKLAAALEVDVEALMDLGTDVRAA